MAAELNFSEYQAIRRRHQREEEDDAAEDTPPKTPPTKDGANEPTPSESWSERAGAFAELHETQLVMTLLIVADLAASTFLLLFDCHGTAIAARLPAGAAKLLESFTGFTTFLFFFELCALVVAFQERFFLHPGYAIDVVVAALCLRAEIMLDGDKEVRLLGFLRLWRLSRLHETLNSAERAKTEEAEAAMIQEQERALRSAAPAPVFREPDRRASAARERRPAQATSNARASRASSPRATTRARASRRCAARSRTRSTRSTRRSSSPGPTDGVFRARRDDRSCFGEFVPGNPSMLREMIAGADGRVARVRSRDASRDDRASTK